MARSAMGRPRAKALALALLTASIAAACALDAPERATTIVAIERGATEITVECRAATPLAEDACRAWGEDVLDVHADAAADATAVVLTDRPGAGDCIADFHDAAGAVYDSSAVDCP